MIAYRPSLSAEVKMPEYASSTEKRKKKKKADATVDALGPQSFQLMGGWGALLKSAVTAGMCVRVDV